MNQSLISHMEVKTEISYMPLLNDPADNYDTLNTTFQHAIHAANQLGTNYTIIAVDQALFWAEVVCSLL